MSKVLIFIGSIDPEFNNCVGTIQTRLSFSKGDKIGLNLSKLKGSYEIKDILKVPSEDDHQFILI